MRRRPVIHLVVILAVVLAGKLTVGGSDDVRRSSFDKGDHAGIAVGVVSPPQLLVPRLKSGDQLWGFSHASIDRIPGLQVPALRLSSAAAPGPISALRFFCRAPAGCRPPPRI